MKALAAVAVMCVVVGTTAAVPADAAPPLSKPIPDEVLAASAAPGMEWSPGPAIYGMGKTSNIEIAMADGVVLRGDVYFPTEGGKRAKGQFPVLLTQTPYGKDAADRVLKYVVGAQGGGSNEYLVRRGYISAVVDVRGTGASGGSMKLFDPILGTDGATLVDWAAQLPGSTGKVGLYGSSYLGFTQLLTAATVGKDSPLEAIFPVVAPNDVYKDQITMGGLLNSLAGPLAAGISGGLPSAATVVSTLEDPHALLDGDPELLERARSLVEFDSTLGARLLSGHDIAFNDEFWNTRAISTRLDEIVANDIPAYLVGGHFDLFQRGQWQNYVGLQNAFAGRPVEGPMPPDQPATGRYQLLVTEHAHLNASRADLDELQLRWFDTWLKDRDTGMADTPTPLHVYDLGTGDYTHGAQYPYPAAEPTRFYLGEGRSGTAPLSRNDGRLTTSPPTTPGADSVPWLPVGNPCNRALDQATLGAVSSLTDELPVTVPCLEDDRLGTVGAERLTYTSDPLDQAKTIAGPITMTVHASSTRPEAAWVVQVDDVAPDGTSRPLTQGALLGSLRQLDPASTWRSPDGEVLQAGHTYSRSSQQPVPVGEQVRYDVEVFPTYNTVAEGHRIRITLSTAAGHLTPTIPAALDLVGSLHSVQRSPAAASAIQLPLIHADRR